MAGAILGGRPEEDLGVEASRRGGSGRVGEADEEGGGGLPFAGLVLLRSVAVLLVCTVQPLPLGASCCYGNQKDVCHGVNKRGSAMRLSERLKPLKFRKKGLMIETMRSSVVS